MVSATVSLLLLATQLIGAVAIAPNLSPRVVAVETQIAQLIITVAQIPNAPTELTDAVTLLGNKGIEIAKNPPADTANTSVQVQTQPVQTTGSTIPQSGGTITAPMANDQQAPAQPQSQPELRVEVIASGIGRDPINNVPYGEYHIKVSYIDELKRFVKGAQITVDAPDNVYPNPETRTTDTINSADSVEWFHTFSYVPKTTGAKTLTFTSNGLTKTVDLNVQ